ncbi:methyltransferase domain-containing protein [Chelatococcus sambhunathii]|uniref:Methyltransferase domain-containing protein n=1 Tax=Chelatococcus sambhunathii TaxID=363953 RepID=A0ABU1DL15_9HYPH|nr:methyltransferase domain-containing protein [Chelatococcus sambhunathii]MDR4308822.1 methyltransferase domain-containing protein [Chelatococcus sambhunathii]
MALDVVDLREFYARPLGELARRILRAKLRARWPDLKGMRVAGVGYATPYLGVFRDDAERLLAFSPSQMGVSSWPFDRPNASALVDDGMWPLPDAAVDRIVAAHALETSTNAVELLREAWRCLAPGGRLIAIVPNRRGPWAQMDTTPFGHGRPYSRSQLTDLLREALFAAEGWDDALFMPPVERMLMLRSAFAFERMGAKLWSPFAGVHIVEASKQAMRAIPAKPRRRVAPSPTLRPAPAAVPAPAGR